MTVTELAAKIRAKHPGAYDALNDLDLVDRVTTKYPQYKALLVATPAPGAFPAPQVSDNPPAGAEVPFEQGVANKLQTVGSGMAVGAGIPALIEGGITAGGKVADAVADSKVGQLAGDGWTALKNQITGNTPRAFGYAQNGGATTEARDFARASIDYANNAQPEVGELVSSAARNPITAPPGDVTALPPAPALATAGDVAKFPPTPGPAPLDGPAPDVSSFNNPIKTGMFGTNPEAMLKTVETQRAAVGKAIENTLAKYDASGSYYDPTKVNDMVKGMLEKDVNGNVMATGWQGEVNTAMKDALASLKDYAAGDAPISWSAAARIKTGMQGGAKYGAAGQSHAEQAYQQVASLLKNDIDAQATKMVTEKGIPVDVAQYQKLRGAYGTLDSLHDALNVAAKRKFANNPVPWWLKVAGADYLGHRIWGGLTGGH